MNRLNMEVNFIYKTEKLNKFNLIEMYLKKS